MKTELTAEQVEEHNRLFNEGQRLIEGELLLAGNEELRPPDEVMLGKLTKAMHCFEQTLAIAPENWSAMWVLGKIHQRLRNYPAALQWFSRAFQVNPQQPDVAREAGLAALSAGASKQAIQFCEAAVQLRPEDPGLTANLALAYLIAGDLLTARQLAQTALKQVPDDPLTKDLLGVIEDVIVGRRSQPETLGDIQG